MRRSVGSMRMDQADAARDMKKENAMCAIGTCTANPYHEAPKGWGTGRYGGSKLCKKHYREVVDRLTASLMEHGCAPWEQEHPSNQ